MKLLIYMFDCDIPIKIIYEYKFKSWFESEAKIVITIKDINDYFENKISMNTFLIEKVFLKITNKKIFKLKFLKKI